MVATWLSGFWLLLGNQFSPETYLTRPIVADTVELVWFGVGVLGAVAAVVGFFRKPEVCRTLVVAGWPLTVMAVFLVAKVLGGFSLGCFDAILFSSCCGWSVLLAAKSLWPTYPTARTIGVVVWALVLAQSGYLIWQQIGAFNNLALGYADCGEMARLMFNTMTNPGELFLRVNPEKALFYDHFQPGIIPFMPLWLLWPRLELTIVLQVLAVLGTAVPVFLIGREVLRDNVSALLLTVVWLVYPAASQLIYSSSYGFHFFNFNLPLYFVVLWLWLRRRGGWALAVALWALLIKEEAAILFGMFGVYVFLIERRRALGATITVCAFAYFLFASSVLIPYFNGSEYRAMGYFGHLGSTKLEILLSPFTKPGLFWGKLFEPATFCFAGALLAPLLFVPLKKPAALLIGSLTFLFLAEWYNPMGKSIAFWYQTSLLPVVFFAFILAKPQRATLVGAVVAGVTLSIFLGNTFWSKTALVVPVSPGRLALVKRMGAGIERSATLVATQRVAAHYITQKYLYLEPDLPSGTDCVFMDLRDRWRRPGNLVWLRQLREFQRTVEARSDLHLVDAEDGLLLYARQGKSLDLHTIVETAELPPGFVSQEQHLMEGVNVLGFICKQQAGVGDTTLVRVRQYSRVEASTGSDLAVRCVLTFGDESFATEFQPLGQGIWPTVRWEPGRIYVDDLFVRVPASLRGQEFTVRFLAEKL